MLCLWFWLVPRKWSDFTKNKWTLFCDAEMTWTRDDYSIDIIYSIVWREYCSLNRCMNSSWSKNTSSCLIVLRVWAFSNGNWFKPFLCVLHFYTFSHLQRNKTTIGCNINDLFYKWPNDHAAYTAVDAAL